MKTTPVKPRVFIASSSEMLPIAEALKAVLSNDADVSLWDDEAVFLLGDLILERLLIDAGSFDFGVFVFGGDDLALIRGRRYLVARDNVLLEAGIYAGRLGRERTFLLVEQASELHLPSDLQGLVTARFDAPDDLADKGSLQQSVSPAAKKIRATMAHRGIARSTVKALSPGMVFIALCLSQRGYSLEELGEQFMWFEEAANRLAPVDPGPAYASKAAKYACQCLEALGLAEPYGGNEYRLTEFGMRLFASPKMEELFPTAYDRKR